MKALLAICLCIATHSAAAGDKPAAMPLAPQATMGSVSGEVLEVMDVQNFTYLRLKLKEGETWAAVGKAKVTKGSKVTVENASAVTNFESKTLKRTFPTILFGTLAGASGATAMSPHGTQFGMAAPAVSADAKVDKASGANARTVAEVYAKSAALKDKPVEVRGRVVKYNAGIMGRNWIHLRDGSGASKDQTDDLLVTSNSPAQVGEIVTVKGTLRTDQDFGAGYAYKVLVEQASLQR